MIFRTILLCLTLFSTVAESAAGDSYKIPRWTKCASSFARDVVKDNTSETTPPYLQNGLNESGYQFIDTSSFFPVTLRKNILQLLETRKTREHQSRYWFDFLTNGLYDNPKTNGSPLGGARMSLLSGMISRFGYYLEGRINAELAAGHQVSVVSAVLRFNDPKLNSVKLHRDGAVWIRAALNLSPESDQIARGTRFTHPANIDHKLRQKFIDPDEVYSLKPGETMIFTGAIRSKSDGIPATWHGPNNVEYWEDRLVVLYDFSPVARTEN